MPFLLTPYAVALGIAALFSAVVMSAGWLRRMQPGGTAFTLMMTGVVVWTGSAALEAAATDPGLKVRLAQLMYFGTAFVPPLFQLFVLRHRRRDGRFVVPAAIALWLVPLATAIIAATNEWHHLLWSSIRPSPVAGSNLLVYEHGHWYFVFVAYCLVVTLSATVGLVRAAIGTPAAAGIRSQNAILIAAAAAPWAGTAVYVSGLNPWPGLDLVALSFAVTGLLLLLGLGRFRLLDVVPVAHSRLFTSMPDGLVVLDGGDRVADINPAAQQLFGVGPEAFGRAVERLPGWRQMVSAPWGPGEERIEAAFPGDPPRFLDLRVTPFADRRGRLVGRLVVIRDITTRRQVEQERERLIGELREALADLRTLRGLLPICAGCKKIRDDRGYWQGLEQYLSEHSEATFTHGLCPECLARYDPDLEQRSEQG